LASFTELHTPNLLVFQASKKNIRVEKWFFPFADSKVTLYICRVSSESPGSWVDRVSPVFFFYWSFYLTQTGSATGLTGSQVNPPGWFGFNNTGYAPNPMKKVAFVKKQFTNQIMDEILPTNQP
jgi:hypothetical protein